MLIWLLLVIVSLLVGLLAVSIVYLVRQTEHESRDAARTAPERSLEEVMSRLSEQLERIIELLVDNADTKKIKILENSFNTLRRRVDSGSRDISTLYKLTTGALGLATQLKLAVESGGTSDEIKILIDESNLKIAELNEYSRSLKEKINTSDRYFLQLTGLRS